MEKINAVVAETENRSIYRHKQSEAKKTNEIHRYFDSSINFNSIFMQLVNDEDPFKDVYNIAIIFSVIFVIASASLVAFIISCLI